MVGKMPILTRGQEYDCVLSTMFLHKDVHMFRHAVQASSSSMACSSKLSKMHCSDRDLDLFTFRILPKMLENWVEFGVTLEIIKI